MVTIIHPLDQIQRLLNIWMLPWVGAVQAERILLSLGSDARRWQGSALGEAARGVLRRIAKANEEGLTYVGLAPEAEPYRGHVFNSSDRRADITAVTRLIEGVKFSSNVNDFYNGLYTSMESMGHLLGGYTRERVEETVARLLGERTDITYRVAWEVNGWATVMAEATGAKEVLLRRAGMNTSWMADLGRIWRVETEAVRVSNGRIYSSSLVEYVDSVSRHEIDSFIPTREQLIVQVRQARAKLFGADSEAEEKAREERRAQASVKYDAFRRSLPKEPAMVIAGLPIQEHGTRSSRRWGIEIETGAGRDLSGTPKGWEAKDDGSLESAYADKWVEPDDCPEADHREYIMVRDVDTDRLHEIDNPEYSDPDYCDYCGHIGGDWMDEDCVELVSPILTSFHSRGLEQICDDLEHAPRTESAGIHVHVEATDLTPQQVRNLVLIYDRFEPLIESSYDRVERGYCKLRSTRELLSVVRGITPNSQRITTYGDRYVTVNLWALDSHGTIEFRAMGPRYNYDHLIRWAQFCREIVNAAANGATPKDALKVKNWDGVMDFFRKFGVEINRAEAALTLEPERELVEV